MVRKIICITAIVLVELSDQRLSRLRKDIQVETNDPTEFVQKQDICMARCFSDVELPRNCEQPARMWLDSLDDDVSLQCTKHPRRHGKSYNS